MSTQICTANEILELNQNKEYTLTATYILETVLTDPNLNAQSAKLWQILFNKARFHSNLEVKVSYSELAQKLLKSVRTISRYIKTLVEAGYLSLKHNFAKDGSQCPNTLYVRVPKNIIEKASNTKNRNDFKIKGEHSDIEKKEAMTLSISTMEVAKLNNKNMLNDFDLYTHQPPQDKIDQHHPDSYGRQINSIEKENNNNNIVVSLAKNKKEKNCSAAKTETNTINKNKIEKQRTFIDKLKAELSNEEQRLKSTCFKNRSHHEYYEIFQNAQKIRTQIELANQYLSELQANSEKEERVNQRKLAIVTDSNYMMNKEGRRALSNFAFKRLVSALKNYGYDSERLICLINEIIFEVRFGHLVMNNQTKEEMNVERALNIALKLVREGRWTTPIAFNGTRI